MENNLGGGGDGAIRYVSFNSFSKYKVKDDLHSRFVSKLQITSSLTQEF